MAFFKDSDKWTQKESDKKIELMGLDPLEITEELHGGPLIQNTEDKIFGKYSHAQVFELMSWSGIFAELEQKGYLEHHLEVQILSEKDQRIFVKTPINQVEEILIHIRLKLSDFLFRLHPGAPQRKLLYIDWLLTKHPRSKKVRPDRLFPGQEMPGLGIFGQISDFITNLALGVGAKGAFNIPEYFHDAVLFHREFRFYDPVREGLFRGMIRDLRAQGAREISKALSEGRIFNQNNEVVTWTPGEMISILDPDLEETIWSKEYYTRVIRELKRVRFKMLPRQ